MLAVNTVIIVIVIKYIQKAVTCVCLKTLNQKKSLGEIPHMSNVSGVNGVSTIARLPHYKIFLTDFMNILKTKKEGLGEIPHMSNVSGVNGVSTIARLPHIK